MDTYHWDVLATYHWDVVWCFIWDLEHTDGTSLLHSFETLLRCSNKTSWRHTTETSWRRSIKMSLGSWFGTYLPRSWDVQRDVVPTSPRRLNAGWTATFINVPANLLNKDPNNPPDWIILEIWALESFVSACILLSNAFLSYAFCVVVNNDSWGRSFSSNIFKLLLKVVPVLFLTAVFSFFSCVSVNFTFSLLYSTIYM